MNEKLSRIIFDSIRDGVFTVDKNCIITSFNRSAEEITGFSAGEAVGKHCYDIFRTEVCHKQCALKDTLKKHVPVDNIRVTIITKEGCEIPINVTTTILRDDKGNNLGAVEFFHDVSEVEHLRKRLAQENVLEEIVSVNPDMNKILQLLPDIADSECNVLVQGPSGSGKELIAQAIHNLSPRKYGPYVKINCAALPETLLESELFGYEKGAFTDAKRDKPGMFCLANGGTLLLDEISEMSVALQVKLLRVLNNGEFQPLGSTRTLHSDARIIAATNSDLRQLTRENSFREDLYFRINVVTIEVPPLCDRREDIPLLAIHFIAKLKRNIHKQVSSISPEVLHLLRHYAFPGNVRELENAIEHAMVMCHGDILLPEHLPSHIVQEGGQTNGVVPDKKSEKEVIREALQRHRGNRSRVAEELSIHRSTLWRKIRMYQLEK
ncbi:sigma 54-interacting transcriptional regulator [bacterium]|nr:sigma 54-interacting transcriptional regulator [bacterium]